MKTVVKNYFTIWLCVCSNMEKSNRESSISPNLKRHWRKMTKLIGSQPNCSEIISVSQAKEQVMKI